MKLFDRDGNGSEEITAAVGIISNGITFDKWRPLIPFGIRDVVAIVGREPVEALADYYENGEGDDAAMADALAYLQQAVAFFTWLKIIPTLDAQHGDTGRAKSLGENEKRVNGPSGVQGRGKYFTSGLRGYRRTCRSLRPRGVPVLD